MAEANTNDPKVVLTMIVRNESPVIERCIRSIRPIIDAWCIVDTGSSDDTPAIVERALADLPGQLHHAPWRDFAHNRTQALELARPWGDFSIMIDADVECVLDPGVDAGEIRSALNADVHAVVFEDGGIHYSRPQITSTRMPFSYRGVLHEFLVQPASAQIGQTVTGMRFLSHPDGARSRNPTKYLDDVALLRSAIDAHTEPDLDPRYTYYLANSLRDAGLDAEAADTYLQRTGMDGWDEERYMSWLWFARLRRHIDGPTAEVFDALARAHDVIPTRAEACCQAAVYAREAGRMPTAFVWAARAVGITRPHSSLFLEPAVYEWRALYEYSIAAWYVGDLEGGRRACRQLLDEGLVPEPERAAVVGNLALYNQ
jgi:glycosyltransferase involved in cell wall biosynthesis